MLVTPRPPTPAVILPGGTAPEDPRRASLRSARARVRSRGREGGVLPRGTGPEHPRRDLASLGAGLRLLAWRGAGLLAALLTLLLLLGMAGCRTGTAPPGPPPSAAPSGPTAAPTVSAAPPRVPVQPPSAHARIEDERNTIEVFRQAAPAVVFVTQKRLVVDWFAGRATEVPAGSGSGFLWDALGHVVTNYHVVEGAQALSVTLYNQKTYRARVVGVEPKKDIAVLRVEAPADQLTPLTVLDDASKLTVGQKAIAIGNPFGLDHTLTTGVVSALGREVQGIGGVSIRDMIQTDAAINPGNSGGPLLDSAGRLIGMNTIIYSRSGASAGIGFAVPVTAIARVVPQLIKYGKVKQVGLGVAIDPMGRLERRLGLRGVIVLRAVEGGPARQAGIRGLRRTPDGLELGDVIVGIGSAQVEDYDDFYNALDGRNAADRVAVKVLRGKQVETVSVPLVVIE